MEDGRDPLQAMDVILTGEASTEAACPIHVNGTTSDNF
jgi:hypothetical protein